MAVTVTVTVAGSPAAAAVAAAPGSRSGPRPTHTPAPGRAPAGGPPGSVPLAAGLALAGLALAAATACERAVTVTVMQGLSLPGSLSASGSDESGPSRRRVRRRGTAPQPELPQAHWRQAARPWARRLGLGETNPGRARARSSRGPPADPAPPGDCH